MPEPTKCPGCGLEHSWSYGEPINGLALIKCENVPMGMVYFINVDGRSHASRAETT